MILNGKGIDIGAVHSFHCFIIEIDMRQVRFSSERLDIYGKSVILSSDFHFPRHEVLDRMVSAVMTEFELVGPPSKGETKELVSKTDPKNGLFPKEIPDNPDGVRDTLWIAWTIGQKDPVRVLGQGLVGRSRRRNDSDVTP